MAGVRREKKSRMKKGLWKALWGIVSVLALLGGGVMIYLGFSQVGEVEDAPVPTQDVMVSADAPVTGPIDEVDTNAGPMTVEKMAPMHYFIPALGVYSKIVPSQGFDQTRYDQFEGLKVPNDPTESAWYSAGGSLAGNEPGTEGTTLLASHVSYNGVWGVLRDLYTLKGGEMVYVKDETGALSAWKVTQLRTELHTEFPQEYWAADGVRQLVITTCGEYGRDSEGRWHYLKNIFAIATPVDPENMHPAAAGL